MREFGAKKATSDPGHEERVKEIVEQFALVPPPEPEVKGPPVEETPLAFAQLCEEQVGEYYGVVEKVRLLEDLKDDLRTGILHNLKKERGDIPFGKYVLSAKDTEGRTLFQKDSFLSELRKWVHEQQGDEGLLVINEMIDKHTHKGEPSVTISVKKLTK